MTLKYGKKRNIRPDIVFIAIFFVFGAGIQSAQAQQPVAIVEEVRSPTSDVEIFQYLRSGKNIHLGRSGHIIIGYLKSCLQETITGGQVVIGKNKSKVEGGSVKRIRVECNGGRSNLSAAEAGKSGVIVFRNYGGEEQSSEAQPIRVYSASPFFLLSDRVGVVVIKRLDAPSDPIVLGVKGKTLDLAKMGKRLSLGAKYEVSAGDKSQVFEVDLNISRDSEALIGRLIRF